MIVEKNYFSKQNKTVNVNCCRNENVTVVCSRPVYMNTHGMGVVCYTYSEHHLRLYWIIYEKS